MKTLRRPIHPTVKVLDEKKGIAQYIASDETLDSYREIIRADSWRFDYFAKNAPFVDSHDYGSLDKLVGKVVDFAVDGRRLVETVQWAIDVPEHRLAQIGWKMTQGGFLKAVSVGFRPERSVSRWEKDQIGGNQVWGEQMKDLGIADDTKVNRVYLQVQQLELSSVILGANPNAVAKSFKAGAIDDDDLNFYARAIETNRPTRDESLEIDNTETARAADYSALVAWAEARTAASFWTEFEAALKRL